MPEIFVLNYSSVSVSDSSDTGVVLNVPKIAEPTEELLSCNFQETPSLVRWKVAVAVLVAVLFFMFSSSRSRDLS